jgi:translation initiation factor IF-1
VDSDGEGSPGPRGSAVGRAVVGAVVELLPSALYRVRLDEGRHPIVAHIADRMDRNFVRLLVGDRVRVELSPVDAGRGRIVEKLS